MPEEIDRKASGFNSAGPPFPMMAGIGFVAVFAGAANTPLATIVMAVELFGPEIGPLDAVACVAGFVCSGHAGIYRARWFGHSNHCSDLPEELRPANIAQFRNKMRDAKTAEDGESKSAPALAQHRLAVAKRAQIQQALLYQIASGYLKGERVTHHHPEVSSMRHPQCLELLDTEERLRSFMREHAEELRKVRAVLFVCEMPQAGENAAL